MNGKPLKLLSYFTLMILSLGALNSFYSLWLGRLNDTMEIWGILGTIHLLLLVRFLFILRLTKTPGKGNLAKTFKRFSWINFSAMGLMLLGGPFFIIAAGSSFLIFLAGFIFSFIISKIISKDQLNPA